MAFGAIAACREAGLLIGSDVSIIGYGNSSLSGFCDPPLTTMEHQVFENGRYVGRARSMTEYRRDLPAGLGAKVNNALRQVAQLPWFAKNLGIKVLMSAKLGGVLSKVTGRPAEWPY
jgi:hypothetical protein